MKINKNKTNANVAQGVVHCVPSDLHKVLVANPNVLTIWNNLTPLSRNEWICWVISVKKVKTRKQHIERVCIELKEGIKRPCCWIGCIHRTDKPISTSIQHMLSKKSKKNNLK